MFSVIILVFLQVARCNLALHPDENLTITEFIIKYNYPVETHTIETDDGYLLKAHRIPHGVTNKESKRAVLLAHGMGGSAENFIYLGPPDALAFYLADRGYDVWLFNARGTAHSRSHRSLNPIRDRKKFWNFSWHQIGVYDLPATINYILKVTGTSKIFYSGHSQGTTILFVMLSELPEMNEKIMAGAMLASSAHLSFTQSPYISIATKLLGLGQKLLEIFNWHEFPIPNSPMLNGILKTLCRPTGMQEVCVDVLYIVGGTDSHLFNKSLLPFVLTSSPSGFSVKQVWHYGQVIGSGEFKQYDYGEKKNLKLYNSVVPPTYNLSSTRVPMALFYGDGDVFSNSKMNNELSRTFPNVILKYQIPVEGWNHLDYLLAYNAKEILYDRIDDVFKQCE
ncbi:lipase 1-like [Anthonomus grandis grandis]|uniref:lipase 1-like n=1 Tax=Anthonomus grandis grandis TaxID=2921223 RepID=UPI00216636F4|nr:lipase 1-like [Anthonomus grandis grandis]